jgi:hypothetical protein
MKHSESCLRQQAAYDEYVKKYPNFCKKCWGSGILHDRGDRDTPPSDDLCGCVESGICPRCGTYGLEEFHKGDARYPEDHVRCDHCGWNDELNDSAPDAECDCEFVDEEERYQELEDGESSITILNKYPLDPSVRSILDIKRKEAFQADDDDDPVWDEETDCEPESSMPCSANYPDVEPAGETLTPDEQIFLTLYNLLEASTARSDNEVRYEALRIVSDRLGCNQNPSYDAGEITSWR